MSFADSLAEQADYVSRLKRYASNRARRNGLDPIEAAMLAEYRAHSGESVETIVAACAGEFRRTSAER